MNVNRNLWTVLFLSVLVFMACNDDESGRYNPLEVRFSSVVKSPGTPTRVAGNAWAVNDQVGVYMIKAGTTLSEANLVNGADNKKYVTSSGDGNFQAQNTNEIIYYPKDGAKVDFISYYPYKEGLTNFTYPVDVADQTNQASLDLLYSSNAKNLDMNASASLSYQHQLTRVVLNVKSLNGITSLSGLVVKFTGFKTKASFSLVNGTLTVVESSKMDVLAKVSQVAGGGSVAEAILLPAESLSNAAIEFTLPSAGTFTYELPAGQTFAPGVQINYEVELSNTGGENKVVVIGSTITPWNEQDGGKIEVDFGGDTTDPDPDPDPTTQTIFNETFGATPTTLTGEASYVGVYPDYDNKAPITFSNPYAGGKANIRVTKTFNDNHLWLPANADNGLLISGINTEGCTNLVLTYDILPNLYAVGSVANVNTIQVKWNGTALNVPDHELLKDNGDDARFYAVTIPAGLTATSSATLEFFGPGSANTLGFRLDNIKIVGDK